MNMKQEKIKKLKTELQCLQVWVERGMVPKEDIEEYQSSIKDLQDKIEEEKEKVLSMNDSFGDAVSKLQSVANMENDVANKVEYSEEGGGMFFDEEEDSEHDTISESDFSYDSESSSDGGDFSISNHKDFGQFSNDSALFKESQEWMHDSGYERDDC
ncbi:MAG: hypothetical protein KAH32_01155 [Chlamydiia bacterium]|nr:hypothetical protein [Chlamydiia bacterium]